MVPLLLTVGIQKGNTLMTSLTASDKCLVAMGELGSGWSEVEKIADSVCMKSSGTGSMNSGSGYIFCYDFGPVSFLITKSSFHNGQSC